MFETHGSYIARPLSIANCDTKSPPVSVFHLKFSVLEYRVMPKTFFYLF